MKKIFGLLTVLLFLSQSAQAQDFSSAVGLRLGNPLSLSYKTFTSESTALEGILGTQFGSGYSSFALSGAYLIHNNIESVSGLQWYYGGGPTAYFYSFDAGFGLDSSSSTFGVSGYLGLSYTLADTPINFSVDWVPTFFFSGFGDGFSGDTGSFAVRYVLGR